MVRLTRQTLQLMQNMRGPFKGGYGSSTQTLRV